jgi:vitamin K-dependent gamma-carboxylase
MSLYSSTFAEPTAVIGDSQPHTVSPGGITDQPVGWHEKLFLPVDNGLLIFFRVFFGTLMIFHCLSMITSGWVSALYINPVMHFTYPGFGWVRPWPGNGMYLQYWGMTLAAVGIAAGFWYRLSAVIFATGMTHVFLIEKSFYLNHYYLICLLSWLLAILPANQALSIDSLRRPEMRSESCPAWCLWLLRLQLAIPYFYGGLAKFDPDWLQGYPMEMWLRRKSDLPWLSLVVDYSWAPLAFSYGGLLLDLFVVPLIFWSRTRLPMYALIVVFHLMNSTLFEIGIFPWMMIGATLVFFPADLPRRLLRLPLLSTPSTVAPPVGELIRRRFLIVGLSGYVAWQLLFPFRCLLYPGPATWTEEGHHFAWHMMLREKDVGIRFYIRNRATGEGGVVDARSFLSSRQISRMAKDSDMILTFVHFLRDHFRSHGRGDLQIRVLALASLNGRRPQLLLDPDIDYARVERTFRAQPWILPLTEPLRSKPWTEPLNEWENHVLVPGPEEMVQEAPSSYGRNPVSDHAVEF